MVEWFWGFILWIRVVAHPSSPLWTLVFVGGFQSRPALHPSRYAYIAASCPSSRAQEYPAPAHNEDSRIHLIGGHGDLVWPGGSFNNTPTVDRETWHVNGGEAVAAIYTFKQPGLYAYLNHNLIEAFMLGGVAHVVVEGKWNNDLMEQVEKPGPIKK